MAELRATAPGALPARAADCDAALWTSVIPDPGAPGRHRTLADLPTGPHSPVSHIEWHLDRPAGNPSARCPQRP
ncbi:MAG: hypothetical protein JWN00_3079 [Actinomycetia bacterium]|nr:hypothetical protein [Actinomycetes bacterium]